VSVEIAPCSSVEELADALVIGHYFGGGGPDVESAERFSRNLPVDRMHAVRVDGEVVGGGGAFPFRLTVPGGTVPAGGVTVVGVLPTHTRRGLLTALMRAQLEDMRSRGEHVAYLWASDDRIYGRFGFGAEAARGYASPYAGEHFMAAPLGPEPLPGVVVYLAPFASLG